MTAGYRDFFRMVFGWFGGITPSPSIVYFDIYAGVESAVNLNAEVDSTLNVDAEVPDPIINIPAEL